jgi:hypothetical protein
MDHQDSATGRQATTTSALHHESVTIANARVDRQKSVCGRYVQLPHLIIADKRVLANCECCPERMSHIYGRLVSGVLPRMTEIMGE